MRTIQRPLILFGAILVLAATGLAAARPLHEQRLDVWTADHGLPHNTVLSLAQTKDGYLWIGTWEGLVRFDGSRFTPLPASMPAALRESGILALTAADDGSLWIGTHGGGIYRYHQGRQQQLSEPGKDLREHVITLLVTRDGAVYAGTSGGSLLRRQGEGFVALDVGGILGRGSLLGLAEDRDGRVIAASDVGLLLVSAQSASPVPLVWPEGQPLVSRVYPRSAGGFWLATSQGIYALDGRLEVPQRLPFEGAISRALEDVDGSLWLASDPLGLVHLLGGEVSSLGRDQSLPNSRIAALLRDKEENLWIGTNGGLARLHAAPFAAITERHGLPDNFVRTLLQRRDASIVVGSAAGLSLLRDGQMAEPPAEWAQLLPEVSVLSLGETVDDKLLVGTSAQGAFEIGPGMALLRSAPEHLLSPQVRTILADNDGGIWYGSTRGLSHCKGSACRQFSRENGLAGDYITALHRDRQGALWVGTSLGASRQKDDHFERIAIGDNVAVSVFGFLEDSDGRLWLSSDGGIGLLRGDRFSLINQSHGLIADTIFAMLQDKIGYFWLSSNRGVMRIDPEQAVAVIESRQPRLEGRRFSRADGLPSNQINGGSQPSALSDFEGRLWFATAGGVASIRPDDELIEAPLPPPRAALEAVIVDGVDVGVDGSLHLQPNQRRLQFGFTGISFTAPARLQLRYRLRGFEDDWHLAGADRIAGYSNLSPGSYRFELEAGWLEQPDAGDRIGLDVVVHPAWFQRTAVQLAAVLALLALILLALRLRLRALRERAAGLESEIARQTFSLTAERDALSQANRRNAELLVRLGQLASEDALTGLANRRRADQELAQRLADSSATALHIALLDIDDFKGINDRFGHSVGDRVLQGFAAKLRESVDPEAFCARVGGEEFLVLWSNGIDDAAEQQLGNFRQSLINTNWREHAEGLHVRFSAGLTRRHPDDSVDSLYRRADQALYRAKAHGRDRVEWPQA